MGGYITVIASGAKEEVPSSKVLLHKSYFYETPPDSVLGKMTNRQDKSSEAPPLGLVFNLNSFCTTTLYTQVGARLGINHE